MKTNNFHEFSVNMHSLISGVLISSIFDLMLFIILYHFLIFGVMFRFDTIFQPKYASFLYVHNV